MNINEIKQELAKKFANMSYEEYESFKYDLDVMYLFFTKIGRIFYKGGE